MPAAGAPLAVTLAILGRVRAHLVGATLDEVLVVEQPVVARPQPPALYPAPIPPVRGAERVPPHPAVCLRNAALLRAGMLCETVFLEAKNPALVRISYGLAVCLSTRASGAGLPAAGPPPWALSRWVPRFLTHTVRVGHPCPYWTARKCSRVSGSGTTLPGVHSAVPRGAFGLPFVSA